jgi:hypothetical protein
MSLHLADVGPLTAIGLLRRRAERSTAGLRYAQLTIAAPLGGELLPSPQLGRVGLIAAWEDDRALDRFLSGDALAARFAPGWHVRLEPLRASGAWPALPGLAAETRPVDDNEAVAVLTLGRLRLGRTLPFLRASAAAEAQAVADPAVLASTGLARPPRIVATFSLWRTAAEMRAYAYGKADGKAEGKADTDHKAAISAHRARAFHHESVFARFRPYASSGLWDGRDPLSSRADDDVLLTQPER